MLESEGPGGKCADLNALYVGLARAAGLPARDVYGIRVAASQQGYQSLGTTSKTSPRHSTAAPKCISANMAGCLSIPRTFGKLHSEEPPGNLRLDHEIVKRARSQLFGSWEMNWMALNFAHDVALPGSAGQPVGFLMYPQAETSRGRIDASIRTASNT
jgi:hypothetical protein